MKWRQYREWKPAEKSNVHPHASSMGSLHKSMAKLNRTCLIRTAFSGSTRKMQITRDK